MSASPLSFDDLLSAVKAAPSPAAPVAVPAFAPVRDAAAAPAPALASAPAPAAPMPAAAAAPVKASAPSIDDAIAAAAVRDVAPAAAAVAVPRKARRGRKPLSATEKRRLCISVRVNADEAKAIDAKRGKVPAGEFLRVVGLDAAPAAAPPALNREAWLELSRAAANLNQIARALNSGEASAVAAQALDTLREFRFALIGAKLPEPSPAA